jgi:hypothetical protein
LVKISHGRNPYTTTPRIKNTVQGEFRSWGRNEGWITVPENKERGLLGLATPRAFHGSALLASKQLPKTDSRGGASEFRKMVNTPQAGEVSEERGDREGKKKLSKAPNSGLLLANRRGRTVALLASPHDSSPPGAT